MGTPLKLCFLLHGQLNSSCCNSQKSRFTGNFFQHESDFSFFKRFHHMYQISQDLTAKRKMRSLFDQIEQFSPFPVISLIFERHFLPCLDEMFSALLPSLWLSPQYTTSPREWGKYYESMQVAVAIYKSSGEINFKKYFF